LYDLNPVALNAQASVPVPEGLDLDAWIVPPPPDTAFDSAGEEDDGVERKAKKTKKGKEKAHNGSKSKGGKKRQKEEGAAVTLATVASTVETAEERAEVERVRACLSRYAWCTDGQHLNSGELSDSSGFVTTLTI
jgi:AP-3 complex subunit delta-1